MPASSARRLLLAALTVHACVPGSHGAEFSAGDDSIVVTATRAERSAFDLPVSIDALQRANLQDGQLQINLSESLGRIPGIVAQNRQNYAQDLQISSRGFGARSSFGVRGLRLYADGVPATMPDGQGQVSHIDLGSAARVEVMRGPFSALYGNSSGGVVAVFSEDGAPGAAMESALTLGSYGAQRIAAKFSGDTGPLNYVADVADFRTGGFRSHSAARRGNFNAKLGWKPDAESRLTLVANAVDMPAVQDPLGLTRAQYDADRRQATPEAYAYNTRKSVAQQQIGASLDQEVGVSDSAKLTLYDGHRATTQYQAIAAASQAAPSSPGGVVDLEGDYAGADARWTHRGKLADAPLTLTLGFSYEALNQSRKGFENFAGAQLGVRGKLRRDETNFVDAFDQYVQAQWDFSAAWLFIAGVRHSAISAASRDKYIVAGNGDDSGSRAFAATTPVLGATWRLAPALNLYAAAGRGFETPSLNELAYQPSGAAGLNQALQAATSRNVEAGMKARIGGGTRVAAAFFDSRTRDEIVTATNVGGRSTYQNAAGTRRTGFEMAFDADLGSGLGLALAYTKLDASYTRAFRSCRGSPCTLATAVAIAAGNSMPGIPDRTLYGELSWKHHAAGFQAALELRHTGSIYVDDQNSASAPRCTMGNLRLGFEQKLSGWTIREFLRVDNAGDAKYAGSVSINEGSGRFFEPAPGRNYLVVAKISHEFQ